MKKRLFITACLFLISSLVRADSLAVLNDIQNPALIFLKNVEAAEKALIAGDKKTVTQLISQLPNKPRYELSFGEGIYEDLVKRALIVRVLSEGPAATAVLTRPFTKTEDHGHVWQLSVPGLVGTAVAADMRASEFLFALNAWFPDDDDVKKQLGPEKANIILPPNWTVQKLHTLYEKNRLKDVRSQVTLSDVESANLSHEDRCQSWFELGSALRGDDSRRDEAIMILKKAAQGNCGDDLTPRALYRLGLTQSVSGVDQRAEFLSQLAAKYPGHRLIDDAYYLLYKIADEQNDDSQRKKNFQKLMSLPVGDMKGVLAFELGFAAYQEKDFAKAVEILSRAADTPTGVDESVTQVKYWLARSLENSGKKTEAKKIYSQLVHECPFSFYAILAAERSGVALKIPKIGSFRTSVTAESNETLSLVDSLNVRGQHAAARAVLDLALQTNLLSENNLGEVLIQKMLESQNYRKAIDLANKSFDDAVFAFGPVSGSTQPAFAALWPDAFHAEINKIAKDVGLQTGAIQGLMREETLFQRTARSWVGARGLMQLMPATAKLVIKGHGLTSLNPDINDINTNITLGATYLKDMLDRFDGKLPFAVMAYNAGPGNVSKWLKRNPNKELDEFIELIPISETRNYVKRVMRSAAVYCAQHGEKFDATF